MLKERSMAVPSQSEFKQGQMRLWPLQLKWSQQAQGRFHSCLS